MGLQTHSHVLPCLPFPYRAPIEEPLQCLQIVEQEPNPFRTFYRHILINQRNYRGISKTIKQCRPFFSGQFSTKNVVHFQPIRERFHQCMEQRVAQYDTGGMVQGWESVC